MTFRPILLVALIFQGVGSGACVAEQSIGCAELLSEHRADVLGAGAQRKDAGPESPFALNDFGVPSGVAGVIGVTTSGQITRELARNKLPHFEYLGVKWARLHPNIAGSFGWSGVDPDHSGKDLDFAKQDAMVKLAQQNQLHLLVGISPTPLDTEWLTARTYVPKDKQAYSSYVTQLVERYDGDGKDDMPGLKYPVKHWQLENEPDLHNAVRNRRSRSDFSSPDEYFEVLKLTYATVKKADPDGKLLLNVVGVGQGVKNVSNAYLEKLNNLGAQKHYDIFSYHVYPQSYDTAELLEALRNFKRLAGQKPIWITESGINGKVGETEKQQAAWVIKHYVCHLAHGVKKVVWLNIADMSPGVPERQVAKYSGLLTFRAKTPKLSYCTYKKMVAVLDGSDWRATETIQERDGICVYKFLKAGKPIWVAWNDEEKPRQLTIASIDSKQVRVIEGVPKFNSGKDIEGYEKAFRHERKAVQDNKVTITLRDSPVFVESD